MIEEVINRVIHSLPYAAFAISVLALALAYVRSERRTIRKLRKRVNEHEFDLAEVYTRCEQITGQLKRMNSRMSMATARAKKANGGDGDSDQKDFRMRDGESVAEWKTRCRAAIASGALKHGD